MLKNLKKKAKENILLIAILVIFSIISYYFVFTVRPLQVFPDENYHYNVILTHDRENDINPSINNYQETQSLGELSRQPYLYHYVFSKLLKLNIFNINDVIWLRLFNPPLALISILTTYLIALTAYKKKIIALSAAAIFASTLMFQFISAAINYDNFVIPFSLLSVYFLIKFHEEIKIKWFIFSLTFILLATLSKFSALVIIVPIFLFNFYKLFLYLKSKSTRLKLFEGNKPYLGLFILILSSLLFINLYFVNIFQYHSVLPKCDTVLTVEECMNSNIYARDKQLADNFNPSMIQIGPFTYIQHWIQTNLITLFGVAAHGISYNNLLLNYVIFSMIIMTLIVTIADRKKFYNLYSFYFITIMTIYSGSLFYLNYNIYLHLGNPSIGIQGRYLIPILPLFIIIFTYGIYEAFKKKKNLFRTYVLFIIFTSNLLGLLLFILKSRSLF